MVSGLGETVQKGRTVVVHAKGDWPFHFSEVFENAIRHGEGKQLKILVDKRSRAAAIHLSSRGWSCHHGLGSGLFGNAKGLFSIHTVNLKKTNS